jgi:hypothetical protein
MLCKIRPNIVTGDRMTSIGFGGNEVILAEVRERLQRALAERSLLQLEAANGEVVVINPEQVKVLQNSGPPEPFNPQN